MQVIEFLRAVLDAQKTITLLTIFIALGMLIWGPGTPELWAKLIEATMTVFVGGGFLRDAVTTIAGKYTGSKES